MAVFTSTQNICDSFFNVWNELGNSSQKIPKIFICNSNNKEQLIDQIFRGLSLEHRIRGLNDIWNVSVTKTKGEHFAQLDEKSIDRLRRLEIGAGIPYIWIPFDNFGMPGAESARILNNAYKLCRTCEASGLSEHSWQNMRRNQHLIKNVFTSIFSSGFNFGADHFGEHFWKSTSSTHAHQSKVYSAIKEPACIVGDFIKDEFCTYEGGRDFDWDGHYDKIISIAFEVAKSTSFVSSPSRINPTSPPEKIYKRNNKTPIIFSFDWQDNVDISSDSLMPTNKIFEHCHASNWPVIIVISCNFSYEIMNAFTHRIYKPINVHGVVQITVADKCRNFDFDKLYNTNTSDAKLYLEEEAMKIVKSVNEFGYVNDDSKLSQDRDTIYYNILELHQLLSIHISNHTHDIQSKGILVVLAEILTGLLANNAYNFSNIISALEFICESVKIFHIHEIEENVSSEARPIFADLFRRSLLSLCEYYLDLNNFDDLELIFSDNGIFIKSVLLLYTCKLDTTDLWNFSERYLDAMAEFSPSTLGSEEKRLTRFRLANPGMNLGQELFENGPIYRRAMKSFFVGKLEEAENQFLNCITKLTNSHSEPLNDIDGQRKSRAKTFFNYIKTVRMKMRKHTDTGIFGETAKLFLEVWSRD